MEHEIHGVYALTPDLIKELLLPVFDKYRDRVGFAYLFGSAAQAERQPSGDIDIAVFISGKNSLFDTVLSLYADFCRVLRRNDVDVVLLNTATNIILLDEIVRHGMVLFDGAGYSREDFECRVLHRAIDFKTRRLESIGV